MIDTLDKVAEKRLARPLNVLAPIIKQDLLDMKGASEEAAIPYQTKIGEELEEARPHFETRVEFDHWTFKTFRISASTSYRWRNSARAKNEGIIYTVSEIYGDNDRDPDHAPKWKRPVRKIAERAKREARFLRERHLSKTKEREAERKLALKLITIGYKILATELHPDKQGGSNEAMSRLNTVRARLKEAA
jgi:hypothetical protein